MLGITAVFINDRCIELNCQALEPAACAALFNWLKHQSHFHLPQGQWVLADGQIAYLLTRGLTSAALFVDIEAKLNKEIGRVSLKGVTAFEEIVTHELKVNWGGVFGPDLASVAHHVDLSESALVQALLRLELCVSFNGFMPGFAYLTGLPKYLHIPRRDTPRTRVQPGSVAMAAGYAAIYPQASPGGWHILGTCTSRLFDIQPDEPACLLKPGDKVRFV